MPELVDLGWNEFFESAFNAVAQPQFLPARVSVETRRGYRVYTSDAELQASAAGKLHFASESPADLPKVGDWVAIQLFDGEDKAVIHHVLPRKSQFSRKVAGEKMTEQVLAVNLDLLFIMQSLDGNYNLNRIERYLVMARDSDIDAAIVLNKSDMCENTRSRRREVQTRIPETPVLTTSAKRQSGLRPLKKLLKKGMTCAFIGSSGVGKSTLINLLLGEEVQQTREVRDKDAKGRHTTTQRELFILPGGTCVIDTPGMRELQLWHADEGIHETFSEIEELAPECRFKDCSHINEPVAGCAVKKAVENGDIARERYDSFVKLQRELEALRLRRQEGEHERRRQERIIHRTYRKTPKRRS